MTKKVVHESSSMHVTGKAQYIDDMLLPENALTGYVVTSQIAHGRLMGFNLDEAKNTPGVHAVLCYRDIPGTNQMGAIAHDETTLVEHTIQFIGQALFLIAAVDEETAKLAASKITTEIEELEPVVTIEQAMEKGLQLNPPVVMQRGDCESALAQSQQVIEATITSGAQEHWYLETQVAVAQPLELNDMKVYSSTQHPTETQALIAEALYIGRHQVEVETRRLGGAFGGKETQANMVAIWASLLAQATQRTVKIRLFRDDDQQMTGKRHPFLTKFKVGFTKEGKITAYRVSFNANAGYSTDLSMAILARARTHAENAYFIPDIYIESTAWRTNLPSNTAFRGFGGPQGIHAIEEAIERIAQFLGKDAAEIRYLNFYQKEINNTTPYGELIENNHLETIWNKITKTSDYTKRKSQVDAFNQTSQFVKRGISLTPVKFGISFNTPFLNQAGALVNIYTDGSVVVHHGGIEMGQGLYTKMAQVVSEELGVPFDKIRVVATSTQNIPNTSATAASSGTDLNGMAVKNATDQLKDRISKFLATYWTNESKHTINQEDILFENNDVLVANQPELQLSFTETVNLLYQNRINLSARGFYSTPNLYFDKATQQGRPFHYFVFGMAVSEVELDVLTGKHRILQTDILHDTGLSINENLDIGQIEGAFIQGLGWCTTEEIKWDNKGRMLNHSPDTYKIPGIRDIPEIFRVSLLDNAPNPNTIKQSKAVGEPPFIHAFSVFFAIKYAVAAVKNHKVYPELNIPATHEKIVMAIEKLKQE
ncbi:MAG: xanthine dehydrogenase molybdopterin binding subunit [Bacteroidetes bacterium HGW-Bacteroidetes-4]|jgi:xanthine dehydrogenase molybdopterin binding subunit|nr:MAG: xanthine dehydrogenase molybdopterin binding subunit [Bacteroidetes bacterium HGW-Bacteroidetes-4]